MDKDTGLHIRIDRELRERFREICQAQDKPVAQVLRELMRGYIQKNEAANVGPAKARRSGRGGGKA